MTVTVDQAIKILQADKAMEFEGDSDDLEAAIQLGIEALRRLEAMRASDKVLPYRELPGETKEVKDGS